MKIYVIGDFGLDVYHVGRVRGLSAETAIPVVTLETKHTLPAMAGNVVANLHSLGAAVVPLQPGKMNAPGATCPIKNRLMTGGGQQIARWDETDSCPAYSRGELVALHSADAVIVADYGKGAITKEIIDALQDFDGPLFVDTKQDPSPWIGCKNAILFPNVAEYAQFREQYNWVEKVVLKMGAEGIAYVEYGKALVTRPSFALAVSCVNGAGDTVLAAFTIGALTGFPLPQCLEFASAAAANVVEAPFLERTTTTEDTLERLQALEDLELEDAETDDDEQDDSGGDTAEMELGNRSNIPSLRLDPARGVPRDGSQSSNSLPEHDEPRAVAAEATTLSDTTIANFLRHWKLGSDPVN